MTEGHELKRRGSDRRSLRTSVRLSLQFSFLYAVLSACVFALAYLFTQAEVQDWIRDQMRGDSQTLKAVYQEEGEASLIAIIDGLSYVSFEKTRLYQLLDADGNVLSGNIPAPLIGAIPTQMAANDSRLAVHPPYEVDVYWLREDTLGPYRLIQGAGNHLVAEILEALAAALLLGYVSVIILGLIVGVRVGRITEQRITSISAVMADVSAGQLAARVPTRETAKDDLSRVSAGINGMLDQIGRLLESQQQISNDIAHDMRTPLQRLRQRLERMSQTGTVEPEDLLACQRQTDDIITTFNALLRIAQIEARNRNSRFENVDIVEILTVVAEVFEPAAEEAGIELVAPIFGQGLIVTGDRGLLMQMFSNLVENAIRHCPSGTSITLAAASETHSITAFVADTGPGIDRTDHDRIFRRFFRIEGSRNTSGHGLGLSLVKAIADMHGATIAVRDNNPGALFEIRFEL